MIVFSSRDSLFLSNAYLVARGAGEPAAVIDAGAPAEPLFEEVERNRLLPTHLFLTHRHGDHTAYASRWMERFRCEVIAHPLEASHLPDVTRTASGGDVIRVGDMRVQVLHVPGHTGGHAAFLVDDEAVFCGDTLFRGSVGGTVAPGNAGFDALRHSVLDVLLALPPDTTVYPGHMEPTTVAQERANNRFVRAWLGTDAVHERPCRAMGKKAILLLRAEDYDGGTKCWVRFEDGEESVVPGSKVSEGQS